MKSQYKDYKVAFFGKTGTGKSSLINMLFGLDLPVSTVEEGTKNAVATWVRNDNNQFECSYDSMMVIDTPGISAALENDTFYMPFYHHVLSLADCVVWVVQGNTRSDMDDQLMLLKLKEFFRKDTKKIVCVNMVDKIGAHYRENWDNETNQPSTEMVKLIKERSNDLLRKFSEIEFSVDTLEVCSVQKNYHIKELFKTIKNQ